VIDSKQILLDVGRNLAGARTALPSVLQGSVAAIKQMTDALIAANDQLTGLVGELEGLEKELQQVLDNWPEGSQPAPQPTAPTVTITKPFTRVNRKKLDVVTVKVTAELSHPSDDIVTVPVDISGQAEDVLSGALPFNFLPGKTEAETTVTFLGVGLGLAPGKLRVLNGVFRALVPPNLAKGDLTEFPFQVADSDTDVPGTPTPTPTPTPRPGKNTRHSWLTGNGDSNAGNDPFGTAIAWAKFVGIPSGKPDIFTCFQSHADTDHALNALQGRVPSLKKMADNGIIAGQRLAIICQKDVSRAASYIGSQDHIAYLKACAQTHKNGGQPNVRVAVGHEMNSAGQGGYPWAMITPAQYKAAARLAASIYLDALPDCVTIFNPLRHADPPGPYFPGADVIRAAGPDFYNNGGGGLKGYITNQAEFDAMLHLGSGDNPLGLQAWADWVKAQGVKLFCIPEWGAGPGSQGGDSPAAADQPGYFSAFYKWCASLGDFLDHETYFDAGRHQLSTSTQLPKCAAAMKQSWGG
jgi:hypothetical protein